MIEVLNQNLEESKLYPNLYPLLREAYLEDLNKNILSGSTKEVISSDKSGLTILLLESLLKNYNKSAKIIGTSLCNKILENEECRKRLEIFESPVKIILTNAPNPMSDKIKNYFAAIYSHAQIKEMSSHLVYEFGGGKKEAEFLVLNDVCYFFEHDLQPGEKGARGNFNNSQGALHLSEIFDEAYNKC